MPIYEYRCGACGHEFEEWQKISEKPVRKCPSCEARKVERLVSVTSFQLKGGGWYADGYGSSKKKDAPSKPSEGKAKGDSANKDGKGSSAKGVSAASAA